MSSLNLLTRMNYGAKRGQAMIEYVIASLVLVGTMAIMALFLYVLRENGARIIDLVASEYP